MPSRPRTIAPVRASAALEQAYLRRLYRLIEEMHRSLRWWISAAWRKRRPELHTLMAADESPAAALRDVMRRLQRQWTRRFNAAARDLADYFSTRMADRVDSVLTSALRKGGLSVRFQRSRAVNDVLQATVAENVSLIRSIAQRHLSQVEGMVMRSVQTGRDLEQLTADLHDQLGVSMRRARLIARDQNNKATAVIQRTRQAEIGITEAIWIHSAGGREPRPSHVKAGRERVRYDVREGWYDPDEGKHIWPGELINCRCVARPVVPGFS